MWPHLNLTIDVAGWLAILGMLWKANRVLNRVWDVLQEYPPHRHVGKQVLYPKGMKPEHSEDLEEHSSAARA